MTIDTPYWICAYANNQWDLSESLTKDPSKSGFTRALEVAKGREEDGFYKSLGNLHSPQP